MSFPFFPTLARAVAVGAAMETGRDVVRRRNGLGFAAGDYWDFDNYNDYGNNWDWWFGGGGGDSYNDYDFRVYEAENNWPTFGPYALPFNDPVISASGNELRYTPWYSERPDGTLVFDQNAPFNNFAPGNSGSSGGGGFDWDSVLGLINSWFTPPLDGAPTYDQAIERTTGYPPCDGIWQGVVRNGVATVECVPPPPPRTPKKKLTPQQKAQQQANNQARAAQKKQDQSCPKHPQGLPTWRNPATGKCEVKPPCTAPLKFDSTARRCITPAEEKELYGESNWWIWALVAAGVLVIAKSGNSGGGRRR